MLVGDLQFLFARGELVRHVVEAPPPAARTPRARALRDARTCRSPRPKRAAVRTSDRIGRTIKLLAAEPGEREERSMPNSDELQIGDADLAVDAAVHGVLIEADGKPRLRPRHADIGEDAPHAVEARRSSSCLRRWRACRCARACVGKALADRLLLVGRTGDQRAAAVDQHDRSAGTLRGGRREIADPLQIDRRHERRRRPSRLPSMIGKAATRLGHLVDAVDQIVAEREIARAQCVLENADDRTTFKPIAAGRSSI